MKKQHTGFFGRIFGWIGDLFKGLPDTLKTAVHIGVSVTEALKNFTDSGAADVITSIIPGTVDDKIKNSLREKLPVILTELKLAENCTNLTDPNEIVKCAIETLQKISGDFKSAFLHDLSILIAQAASDGKLSWSDGVLVAEYFYKHEFKK